MQFAKLAIFACVLVAVALAADSEKKEHHKSHDRNKDHHKSRNHHERKHKEGHHERKHKESHHKSHLEHGSRSHGHHGKSERQAVLPQPSPDCVCSAWECPATPTEPIVTPTEPVITPTEPLTPTPTEPVVTPTPTEPIVTPTEPIITPTEPIITPTEPIITPTEPVVTPTPTEPIVSSEDPLTPTPTPIVTPTVGPITVEGSWELEIKISGNVAVKLIYDAELKFFGIYNAEKKLAVIFCANTGFISVFNIATNAAIIFNLSADLGFYIENAGDISGQFGANLNLSAAFKFLLNIIDKANIDANSANAFKISAFLKAIVDGKLSTGIAVFKSISVGFASYVALLVKLKTQIAIYGAISIIIPAFVEITNVSRGFLELFAAISINLGGKFTAAIITLIRKKIELDIAAGTVILGGITGAIRGVGSIFVSLDAALKAYVNNVIIKHVTSGKVVTIDGVVTITSAIVAKGSWLITIVNDKVNVAIIYDKAANVLGILNKKLNVAVVLLGEGNLFGFVNIATGGVLVANYLTSNARIVKAVELTAAFNVDILLIGEAFAKVAGVIKANAQGLGNIIFAPSDSFNLTALVAALTLHFGWEAAYNLVFIGSSVAKAAVDLHFKAIFVGIRAQLGLFGAVAQGGLALILPFTGSIKLVSEGFFNIVMGIYGNLKATFDAELMMSVFFDFNISMVQYIHGEVKALFGTVLGAINEFKGFIGSIFGAIHGIVNVVKQAHVNMDFSFGFGIGFGGAVAGGGSAGGGTGGSVGGGTGGSGGGGGGVTVGGGGSGSGGGGVTVGGGSGGGVSVGGGGGGGVTVGGGGGGGVSVGGGGGGSGGGGVSVGGGGGGSVGGGGGFTVAYT